MSETHEAWQPAFDIARWRAEARMQAYGEPDPMLRMELLGGLLAEGDHEAAPFAVNILLEQTAESGDAELDPRIQTLVGTLVEQRLFAEADQAVGCLIPRGGRHALRVINRLLEKGHAGPGGGYLRLDYASELHTRLAQGRSPGYQLFDYIGAVGAYGEDIMNASLPHGRLLAEGMAHLQRPKQDYYYSSIVYAAALAGKMTTALAARERVVAPYWRALSNMYIATEVAEHDRELAGWMLEDTSRRLDAIGECSGACGRPSCNPSLHSREIEVCMAMVHARQGDAALARVLIGPNERHAIQGQMAVMVEIYKQTGDIAVRSALLEALPENSFAGSPAATADLIYGIARGDLRWGVMLPSPFESDEPSPAICWELHTALAKPSHYERKAAGEGFNDMEREAMDLLGMDPETFVQDVAESRNLHRDSAIAQLAKITAGMGSVQTAKHLASVIDNPVLRVRALAGMAKALEDAG